MNDFLLQDRREAGELLAKQLQAYAGDPKALVLGLPRGGVVVAAAVARILKIPLDVFLARKLRHPDNPELAFGAVSETGQVWISPIGDSLPKPEVDAEIERQRGRIEEQRILFRGRRPLRPVSGMTVILTDDGIATGATVHVAIDSLRALRADRIVIAAPVGPANTLAHFRSRAGEVVSLIEPRDFMSVGEFYADFREIQDSEVVRELLGPI